MRQLLYCTRLSLKAQFDWFIRPEFEEAIAYCPVKINRIIHFPRRRLGKAKSFLPAFIKVINDLRKQKYDLIIDFQGLLRSAIFTSLSRSSQTVGFARPRESTARLAYKSKISIPEECIHAVERNIALVEALTGLKASKQMPALAQVDKFKKQIERIFEKHDITPEDKLIGIIPGARWESKRWEPDFFANIISGFLAENPDYKVLVVGAPSDLPLAQKIIHAGSDKRIISIVGDTSVGEMIEAIRHCQFIFSNDSGPVHIAAALQKTVFAVFGPTDPDKTGPFGDFHHVFQRDLKCIKCLKRTCPTDSYQCHDLDVSKLVSALNNYVKNGESNES